MRIARKSGRGAILASLFGFAELMSGAEYKNRVTMRHSMQKIQNEALPIGSAKHITILEIAPPRASFAYFSWRARKVCRDGSPEVKKLCKQSKHKTANGRAAKLKA